VNYFNSDDKEIQLDKHGNEIDLHGYIENCNGACIAEYTECGLVSPFFLPGKNENSQMGQNGTDD
jgi:hypothetical protein